MNFLLQESPTQKFFVIYWEYPVIQPFGILKHIIGHFKHLAWAMRHGLSAADAGHQFHLWSDSEVFLAVQNLQFYLLVQSTVTFRLWWRWWLCCWWLCCWWLLWWWLLWWWCLNCLFNILSNSFLVPVPDRFLFFCLGLIFGLLSSYPTIWI